MYDLQREGKQASCVKRLERVSWGERKPWFMIMKFLFLYSILIKLANI